MSSIRALERTIRTVRRARRRYVAELAAWQTVAMPLGGRALNGIKGFQRELRASGAAFKMTMSSRRSFATASTPQTLAAMQSACVAMRFPIFGAL